MGCAWRGASLCCELQLRELLLRIAAAALSRPIDCSELSDTRKARFS